MTVESNAYQYGPAGQCESGSPRDKPSFSEAIIIQLTYDIRSIPVFRALTHASSITPWPDVGAAEADSDLRIRRSLRAREGTRARARRELHFDFH